MKKKEGRKAELRARIAADPDDQDAVLHLGVLEEIERTNSRVAAREAQFFGGENVIRVTAEKVATTEALRRLSSKGAKTVDATRLSVVIPGWARPHVEAVLASDRDRDRRHTFESILAELGPDGGEFLIGEESPIEATYGEEQDENVA